MLEEFAQIFKVTDFIDLDEEKEFYKAVPKEFFTLIDKYGGKSFNKGLYRIHSFESSVHWSIIITEYFEKYQSKVFPFGFDWMGRQFCMSSSKSDLLFMFDPATGEAFELEQNLILLHDDDLVNTTDEMLASNLFEESLKVHKIESINFKECIGYKVPLFLGGKDSVQNQERIDVEVYWQMQNQLYKKVQQLPDGTNIKSIKFE